MRRRDPAVLHLASVDGVMARLIASHGPPTPSSSAHEPFGMLARAIVYQQLSGRAAAAILARLQGLFGDHPLAPSEILSADERALRGAGLSRQKVAALRDLAAHGESGHLAPGELADRDDEETIAHLMEIRGVGRWTAEMYLIESGRPDVLPTADLGLNRAIMRLYGLPALPRADEVLRIGSRWKPYASTACLCLWRSYDFPPAG